MEVYTALIAAVVTISTAVLGYFQVLAKANMDGLAEKLQTEKEHSAKQDKQIADLEKKVAECEADRGRLRTQVNHLVDLVGRVEKTGVVAMIECNAAGKITAWDAGATVLFDYFESDVLGQDFLIICPPALRGVHHTAFHKMVAEGRPPKEEPIITRVMDKEGNRFPVSILMTGWKQNDVWMYNAEIRPITEEEFRVATQPS